LAYFNLNKSYQNIVIANTKSIETKKSILSRLLRCTLDKRLKCIRVWHKLTSEHKMYAQCHITMNFCSLLNSCVANNLDLIIKTDAEVTKK